MRGSRRGGFASEEGAALGGQGGVRRVLIYMSRIVRTRYREIAALGLCSR